VFRVAKPPRARKLKPAGSVLDQITREWMKNGMDTEPCWEA
jgi:hypothetical protein